VEDTSSPFYTPLLSSKISSLLLSFNWYQIFWRPEARSWKCYLWWECDSSNRKHLCYCW